jgi:hypothetical protein
MHREPRNDVGSRGSKDGNRTTSKCPQAIRNKRHKHSRRDSSEVWLRVQLEAAAKMGFLSTCPQTTDRVLPRSKKATDLEPKEPKAEGLKGEAEESRRELKRGREVKKIDKSSGKMKRAEELKRAEGSRKRSDER